MLRSFWNELGCFEYGGKCDFCCVDYYGCCLLLGCCGYYGGCLCCLSCCCCCRELEEGFGILSFLVFVFWKWKWKVKGYGRMNVIRFVFVI